MKDTTWCKRLTIVVGVWAVLAVTLQVVISLALR
jgi:hypothetical protein